MSEYSMFTKVPSVAELKAGAKVDERVAQEMLRFASSWSIIELFNKDQQAAENYELSLINDFVRSIEMGDSWEDIRWQGVVNWMEQLQSIILDTNNISSS